MNPNHVLGTTWGPIEYREIGLYDIDRKLPSVHVDTSMSCFGDFNHTVLYRYLFEKSKKIDKLIKTYQFNISNMINIYVSDLCILVLDPRKFC